MTFRSRDPFQPASNASSRAAVISSPPSRSTRSRSARSAASSSSADDSSSASSPSRRASNCSRTHAGHVGSLLASCERRVPRTVYARPAKANDAKLCQVPPTRRTSHRKASPVGFWERCGRAAGVSSSSSAARCRMRAATRIVSRDPSSSYLTRQPSSTTATTSAPYQRGPPEKRASTLSPLRKSSAVLSSTCTSQSSQRKPSSRFTHPRCRDVWPQWPHVARAHFSPSRREGLASTNRPPGALHRGALQRRRIVKSSPLA